MANQKNNTTPATEQPGGHGSIDSHQPNDQGKQPSNQPGYAIPDQEEGNMNNGEAGDKVIDGDANQ